MIKSARAFSWLILVSGLLGIQAAQKTPPPKRVFPPDIVQQVANTNYKEVLIKKFPVAMQCWTFRKFTFFDTLRKVKEMGIRYIQAFPGQPLGEDLPAVKFDHGLTDDQIKAVKDRLKDSGITLASYGVVDIGTTEESMRKVFDFARKMGIQTIVCEPQDDDFSTLEKAVKEYRVQVAIHNHPEPTKYAHPLALLENVKGRDERIGASADTGHWMRGGLKPVECLRLLQGRIIDLHLKDRSDFGTKKAWDVPFGEGKANVRDILAELTLQDYAGFITIEHENEKDVLNPAPPVLRGLDHIQSITYFEGYDQILRRDRGFYSKHGWNHYGPGHFELDEKTGVLKGQGGMGLLWHSVRKYKDFVLELDYKCADKNTNSGIFLRVPEVPSSDDYIYHSFEVQIAEAGEGIHRTAAVYDAEAPSGDASKPVGEWNHFRITFRGSRIEIEQNGKAVLDWEAQPRGKVRDFASEGYIGLQNHDSIAPIYFRNIFVKEL